MSIVTCSNEANVLLSGWTVHDQLALEHHLDMLEPRGTTNVSGGLFEGVNQTRKFSLEKGINRIILLSDGLANQGVVNRRELSQYAPKVSGENASISTVGVGREFDEELLMDLASAGHGGYHCVGYPGDGRREPFDPDVTDAFPRTSFRFSHNGFQYNNLHFDEDYSLPSSPEQEGRRIPEENFPEYRAYFLISIRHDRCNAFSRKQRCQLRKGRGHENRHRLPCGLPPKNEDSDRVGC